MTRRTWFASIAAAVAARKVPLAAETAPAPAALLPQLDGFVRDVMLPQVNSKVFSHVRYGLGLNVSRELIEDDRYHQVVHRAVRMAEERRQELEAEMYRLAIDPFES